jgi:hypothetical protein
LLTFILKKIGIIITPNMASTVIRNLLKVQLIIFIAMLSCSSAQAQQDKGYSVHANIIYHFTKYINWPDPLKTGDFVIGVIEAPELYVELKKVADLKTVGSSRMVIKTISAHAVSFSCHIVFIGDDASDNLKKIVAATANTPVLLVTETEGAARKGACINFALIDDRLKLEINKTNIAERELRIATELLQLGTVVK